QATPMTYEVNGKQYVVISAGGHGSFGTKMGDYIVAYALPDDVRVYGIKRPYSEICPDLSGH
ncbi:hypothetical protein GP954_41280, partial [Escherichia coli]|nr:hypothetical protein [Escherichia coli]